MAHQLQTRDALLGLSTAVPSDDGPGWGSSIFEASRVRDATEQGEDQPVTAWDEWKQFFVQIVVVCVLASVVFGVAWAWAHL